MLFTIMKYCFLSILSLFLIVFMSSCSKFKVNSKELKIMEGKWKVTSHRFTFFKTANNEVDIDTTLNETGVFEFSKNSDYGGSFTFTASSDNRQVSQSYNLQSYSGTFELTDLKYSVDILLFSEGGSLPLKNIKIVDFGKREQVWYADYSLNIESGANEIFYVEKE